MAPLRDGKIVPPATFNDWRHEEQIAVQQAIESLEKDLEDTLRGMPRVEKEQRDAVLALERETARFAMEQPVAPVKAAFADLPDVLAHIDDITKDLLENVHLFATPQEAAADPLVLMRLGGALERFEVNVMVSQSEHGRDAPVIEELNPTLANLVGRIEYLQMQGALVTNFRLIKAGALHRANGGTLLLDVRALLSERRAAGHSPQFDEQREHIGVDLRTWWPSPPPLLFRVRRGGACRAAGWGGRIN
jgi:predicted ATP-dependent protease